MEIKNPCWTSHCDKLVTLQCSRCKIARYCSEVCQQMDWNDTHKRICCLKTWKDEDRPVCERILPSLEKKKKKKKEKKAKWVTPVQPLEWAGIRHGITHSEEMQNHPGLKWAKIRHDIAHSEEIQNYPGPKKVLFVTDEWEGYCESCPSALFLKAEIDKAGRAYQLGVCNKCKPVFSSIYCRKYFVYRVTSQGEVVE